jgi:hypothetical protein
MAIDLKVRGGFEIIASVENLITLRTEVCIRIFVLSEDGKTSYYDRIKILEVPE